MSRKVYITDSPNLSLTLRFRRCYNEGDHRFCIAGFPRIAGLSCHPGEAALLIKTDNKLQSVPHASRFAFPVFP